MGQRVVAATIAALFGIVAFTLVLMVTDPPGPGLDPDALQYLGAAASVAAHGKYTIPIAGWASPDSTTPLTHFPPGYSTALAGPVRLGMEPAQSARLVNATAAFITLASVVWLVSVGASMATGGLLGLALLAMSSMYTVHSSVLSEPLYLTCLSLVLGAMVLAPDKPLRAGVPAAVAVMTRYAGLSIVAAIALWQLARPGLWRDRFRRAAIAIAPALVLQGVWVVRTRAVAHVSDIRKIALYGKLEKSLTQAGATLSGWLIPDIGVDADAIAHRGALALAAALALAGLAAMGLRHLRGSDSSADRKAALASRLTRAASVLLACYAGLLGASRLFADPGIPFDERIFAPAFLLLAIILAVGLSFWWRRTRLAIARIVVAAALVAWWCAGVAVIGAKAHYVMAWGSDFAGQQWRESDVLAWAGMQGKRAPIYSNWPAAVFFHLHRPSHELPKLKEAGSLKAFGDTVRARGARVLLFTVESEDYVANARIIKNSGLDIIEELSDGWILGAGH